MTILFCLGDFLFLKYSSLIAVHKYYDIMFLTSSNICFIFVFLYVDPSYVQAMRVFWLCSALDITCRVMLFPYWTDTHSSYSDDKLLESCLQATKQWMERFGVRRMINEMCGLETQTRGDHNDIRDLLIEKVLRWHLSSLTVSAGRTVLDPETIFTDRRAELFRALSQHSSHSEDIVQQR